MSQAPGSQRVLINYIAKDRRCKPVAALNLDLIHRRRIDREDTYWSMKVAKSHPTEPKWGVESVEEDHQNQRDCQDYGIFKKKEIINIQIKKAVAVVA